VGSRRRMQERIADIRKRNPGALPAWLNPAPRDPGWYRASWQIDGGIAPDDAARPAVLVLKWLARQGLLTSNGADTLRAAAGNPAGVELSRLMVTPKGAEFLDGSWEQWWSTAGINVAMGPESEPSAVEALDQLWSDFGRAAAT
jgi:hypothetical protein